MVGGLLLSLDQVASIIGVLLLLFLPKSASFQARVEFRQTLCGTPTFSQPLGFTSDYVPFWLDVTYFLLLSTQVLTE